MILGLLFIAVVSVEKAFITNYYEAAFGSAGVDVTQYQSIFNIPLYVVVKNDVSTYLGNSKVGVDIGQFVFKSDIKSIKMTATETKGETTVSVASYTDDSCKQESNKTESLSLKTLEDNYKLKYQELNEVPFAYGMTMPDDTKCPRKESILTMYIGTGCISSKYKDLGIEQSLRYKMIKNQLHFSYYAGSATCEGTAVTVIKY